MVVCLCLSRCLSGRFNYEGLVPHKQYVAGTLVGMSNFFFCIFNFRYNKKSLSRPQNGGHFEHFEILNTPSNSPQIWKDHPELCQKSIFVMMTSSITSYGGLKVRPLYSFINEITTFFMITKKQAKISSLNLLYIGIMRLWLQLYQYIFMTSLMTSPGHKIGQILRFIYLRQYLS